MQATEAVALADIAGTPRSGSRRGAVEIGALVVGAAAVVVSTMVLTSANGLVRVGIVIAGIALLWWVGETWLRRRHPGLGIDLVMSIAWLLLIGALSAFADLLPLPEGRVAARALDEPVLARPDLFSGHPLGTDRHGLDLLSGIAYGGRVSLVVGLGATAVGVVLGGSVGLCAGYFRGRLDRVVGLLTDSMLAFPPLILLLGLVTVRGSSITVVTAGLAVLSIPSFVRLARANAISLANREFVLAARALGAKPSRILVRDILPNAVGPIFSYAVVIVAALIVAEASLSFLGLSVQRPNPTWGNMIAAGEASYDRHPHLVAVPSVCLFLTVFALNRVGEKLHPLHGGTDRNR
ncbi:MAG TPA: ABC transporter permease [Acidimicrobiales bacterium]